MLTAKDNMREVIKGGNPDRFVNQYEALQLFPHPFMAMHNPKPARGEYNVENAWGVINSFPPELPASFPEHGPDKVLIKDITHWQDYVKRPSLDFPEEDWAFWKEKMDAVDNTLAFRSTMIVAGLFEQTHHFNSMTNALMYYVLNPKEMHDLIKFLTEWELENAEKICTYLKPEAIFHHDDWGSETNSFLSPDMFAEFFVEPYKQIYGYYHDHGVELVIHHSDSYGANLVPSMIEMGIDVWQGPMESNDVPALIKQYGGQISFMGNIDNKRVDFAGNTREDARIAVEAAFVGIEGPNYYIPCISQGEPGSIYAPAYESLIEEIDAYNSARFGFSVDELRAQRVEPQIMRR